MIADMGQDTSRRLKILEPLMVPTNEASSKTWPGMLLVLLEGEIPMQGLG